MTKTAKMALKCHILAEEFIFTDIIKYKRFQCEHTLAPQSKFYFVANLFILRPILTIIHIHFHINRVSGPILSLCVRTDAL